MNYIFKTLLNRIMKELEVVGIDGESTITYSYENYLYDSIVSLHSISFRKVDIDTDIATEITQEEYFDFMKYSSGLFIDVE